MEKIFLALDDEITGVIEKIRNAEGDSIALIVPKGAVLVQSVVNIRLLKKKADELHKTLGIITTDPIGKNLATQAGLSVYHSVQEAPENSVLPATATARKKAGHAKASSPSELNVKRYDDEQEVKPEPAPDPSVDISEETDLSTPPDQPSTPGEAQEQSDVIVGKEVEVPTHQPQRTRIKPTKKPTSIPQWLPKALVAMIIIVLLVGVAAAAFIPQAKITLHVPTETLKKEIALTVDSTATQISETTVPSLGKEASADGTGTVKATGKKQVGEKSKGTVTISNSWSSEPQTLAKNSGLVAAEKSAVFRTVSDVIIPGATSSINNGQVVVNAGKVDVAVVADQPGDQYNVGPGPFAIQGYTGDKATKITGRSTKAMEGGTTRELTVVSDNDIAEAKKLASASAEETARTTLKAAVPTEELLINDTIKTSIAYKDANKAVGAESPDVSIIATATVTGFIVKKIDLEAVLATPFKDGLAATKSVILPHVDEITWRVSQKTDTAYELRQEIEGQIITKLDKKVVAAQAKGKKVEDAAASLKKSFEAESVEIERTPSSWPLLPFFINRITVVVSE